MNGVTYIKCTNCNKDLIDNGNRRHAELHNGECAECGYLALVDARTITKYNAWLKKESK